MNRKTCMEHVVEATHTLCRDGFLYADAGLVSARAGDEVIFTRMGVLRARITTRDLDTVRLDGKGKQEVPTDSEAWTHLLIYREQPDLGAVINACPPTATGIAVSGATVDLRILPELLVRLGGVPLIRRQAGERGGMSSSVLPHLAEAKAFLLAHRGLLTVGDDVWEAVARQEQVEHCARVHVTARLMGGAEPVPDQQVAQLLERHFETQGGRNL